MHCEKAHKIGKGNMPPWEIFCFPKTLLFSLDGQMPASSSLHFLQHSRSLPRTAAPRRCVRTRSPHPETEQAKPLGLQWLLAPQPGCPLCVALSSPGLHQPTGPVHINRFLWGSCYLHSQPCFTNWKMLCTTAHVTFAIMLRYTKVLFSIRLFGNSEHLSRSCPALHGVS